MNKQEAAKILTVLRTAFPSSYKNFTTEDGSAAVNLWAVIFEHTPYEAVNNAVFSWIVSPNRWAPTPGELIPLIEHGLHPDAETPEEAWKSVRRAMKNGIYHAEEEFQKLSPISQKLLGSPDQIRRAALGEYFNEAAEERRFTQAYEILLARTRSDQYLPRPRAACLPISH